MNEKCVYIVLYTDQDLQRILRILTSYFTTKYISPLRFNPTHYFYIKSMKFIHYSATALISPPKTNFRPVRLRHFSTFKLVRRDLKQGLTR